MGPGHSRAIKISQTRPSLNEAKPPVKDANSNSIPLFELRSHFQNHCEDGRWQSESEKTNKVSRGAECVPSKVSGKRKGKSLQMSTVPVFEEWSIA